ncbi:hypothetical protein P7C73_g1534, partial [Tremellales sp. Uapishka_1]
MSDWKIIPNIEDRVKWYNNKGKLKLNFFLSVIFVGMILNGYDGTLISGLQALDAWHEDLGNPSALRIGLLNAVGFMSGLVVGPIITFIDETYGRKWGIRFYGWTLLLGSVIGCIAGVPGANGYARTTSFARPAAMADGRSVFVTGRAIIGFGLSSFLMTSLIVVQEIAHPRSRSVVTQSWDSYYIIGSIIASWVVFGTSYLTSSWSWRIPYILQVPLALYVLIAVQFVPETPRFLLAKGRDEEAFDFLVEYHGNGDRNDELVIFEFLEMKETIRMEQEAGAAKWSVILRSAGGRHRLGLAALMTFCTSMSGSSIIYYYYTAVFDQVGITDPTTQTGINAGLSVFTWFCQIAAVYVGKRVGRKTIMMWVWPTLLVTLIGLCVSGGVYQNTGEVDSKAGVATVVLVWIYLGCFNASNPVLYSYPAEVQTYAMRSKGLLVWNTVNQLMGVYVTWVDAVALAAIGYKYYIVYMPLVIIQWLLVWRYMVETKGYTLEEIAHAFEGPNALVAEIDARGARANPFEEQVVAGKEDDKVAVEA